jgi:hypothetical protein
MSTTNFDTVTATTLTGAVTGAVTGNTAGVHTGGVVLPTVTAYTGADAATKAISPTLYLASLTKGSAGNDYTLAAPGSANVGKMLYVYSTGAYAHVVTVAGLSGGTTLTFATAVGNGFLVFAVSSTVWNLVSSVGITQGA